MQIGRFWRTLRHLRPVQIHGRIRFRLARPKPDLRAPPPLRRRTGAWCPPAARPCSLTGPGEFRFLNETGSLAEHGWDGPAKPKLWRYNQHYFDDLNAEGAAARNAWHPGLIADWLDANPPGQGSGWEPYPTSLRMVNWIKWALAGNPLPPAAVASLALQARWLTRRLEWHLLGNHLFANAKALVFAGCFFDGAEAGGWLDIGLRILEREIPEQILADGGQFELSTMYHALAVEDMLDLVNIAAAFGRFDEVERWRPSVAPMLSWLLTMSHPDGAIAFFNDAAWGIAPPNGALLAYASRLGIACGPPSAPICHLPESGYVRMSAGDFVVLADLARIGPDYLPGHAHADTLSFEASFAGQRVFVNSGTSEYGTGTERQRQRGTAAHNTVVVEGRDSSEVWAGFRVGRRARPRNVQVAQYADRLHVEASHDGYRYLKQAPT
jgi:uncharacterized heparinase superfamily protein